MITIRHATEQDVPAVVEMASRFYATTNYAQFSPMCSATVAELVHILIGAGVMLVAKEGDRYVGMVAMFVAPFMFNAASRTAHEVAWWVDPECQSRGIGMQLMLAVEEACRERECVAMQMVHLSNSPPAAAAVYERLGYRHSESCFTKELR